MACIAKHDWAYIPYWELCKICTRRDKASLTLMWNEMAVIKWRAPGSRQTGSSDIHLSFLLLEVLRETLNHCVLWGRSGPLGKSHCVCVCACFYVYHSVSWVLNHRDSLSFTLRSVYIDKAISPSISVSPQDALPTAGCASLHVQREIYVLLTWTLHLPHTLPPVVLVAMVVVCVLGKEGSIHSDHCGLRRDVLGPLLRDPQTNLRFMPKTRLSIEQIQPP